MGAYHWRRIGVSIGVAVLVAGHSTPAFGQAWTPAQGEGAVSIQFQDTFVKYHLLPTVRRDRGQVRGKTLMVDLTYGVTDKVAVSLSLPYVTSKYTGPRPHPTALDDGSYHSAFQDFRFDLRYNLSREGLVVTPFVGAIVPSHGYEHFAHAAPGRNLRELQIGAYWAKLLDPVLPGLFVQGRYSYGFTQEIFDISHNRSNLDVEVGYFVTPELRVFAMGAGQLTHGGVDLFGDSLAILGPVLFPHHDRISRDNMLNVGVGGAYDLSQSWSLYGWVVRTVAGRNVHALQHSVTVGASWSFGTAGGARVSRAPRAADREEMQARALVKCVCQKQKP